MHASMSNITPSWYVGKRVGEGVSVGSVRMLARWRVGSPERPGHGDACNGLVTIRGDEQEDLVTILW